MFLDLSFCLMIYIVCSQIEDTKVLVSELLAVVANERVILDECRELLASTAAMQVQIMLCLFICMEGPNLELYIITC